MTQNPGKTNKEFSHNHDDLVSDKLCAERTLRIENKIDYVIEKLDIYQKHLQNTIWVVIVCSVLLLGGTIFGVKLPDTRASEVDPHAVLQRDDVKIVLEKLGGDLDG